MIAIENDKRLFTISCLLEIFYSFFFPEDFQRNISFLTILLLHDGMAKKIFGGLKDCRILNITWVSYGKYGKVPSQFYSSAYWASEASPTLGCSIEISRDICRNVCRGPKSVGGITWAKRAHAQSQYWAVKSDQ